MITRKHSWRQGKRATAVRVWRPLAKKSTADQRNEHNIEKYIQWVSTLSLTVKSREFPTKFDLTAVQVHPRSSILVSIKSAYATSY